MNRNKTLISLIDASKTSPKELLVSVENESIASMGSFDSRSFYLLAKFWCCIFVTTAFPFAKSTNEYDWITVFKRNQILARMVNQINGYQKQTIFIRNRHDQDRIVYITCGFPFKWSKKNPSNANILIGFSAYLVNAIWYDHLRMDSYA